MIRFLIMATGKGKEDLSHKGSIISLPLGGRKGFSSDGKGGGKGGGP